MVLLEVDLEMRIDWGPIVSGHSGLGGAKLIQVMDGKAILDGLLHLYLSYPSLLDHYLFLLLRQDFCSSYLFLFDLVFSIDFAKIVNGDAPIWKLAMKSLLPLLE